jgi:pimeloyl-ACP methyl ester carboxylesterase
MRRRASAIRATDPRALAVRLTAGAMLAGLFAFIMPGIARASADAKPTRPAASAAPASNAATASSGARAVSSPPSPAPGPHGDVPLTWRTVVATDGVPLAVVEGGNPKGPPILLLHGYSQSSLSWLPQFADPGLATNFRLVAIDLRGHGASGKPWTPESYAGSKPWADDVHAVVTQLALRKPLVVGWSFGGYVAMDYFREYGRDAMSGIVLVSSPGGLIPRPASPPPPPQPDDLRVLLKGAKGFMQVMSSHPQPEDAADLGVATVMTLPPYARRAMMGMRLENLDLVAKLDDVPMLAIVGAMDPSVPGAALAKLLPQHGGRVLTYEGVGHSAFVEATARFDADLAAFAQQVLPADARAALPSPLVRDVPVPPAVHEYIRALNAGDADAGVNAFARDGTMYIAQGRIARGHAALAEIERFHAVVRPTVAPEGLTARQFGDRVVVAMTGNVERSPIFESMGLPVVRTEGAGDAFVVTGGRIESARQPEFAPACRKVMAAAMTAARAWLDERADVRRATMLPNGVPKVDGDTASTWIAALADWRKTTGWAPAPADRDDCAAGR